MTDQAISPLRGRMIEDMTIRKLAPVMTLGHRRVYPQIPDPRSAARLPPYPPLRPARQRHARRQYRPSAPPARRASDIARGRE